MFDSVINSSMMRLAQEKGLLKFTTHDLRDYAFDRHRTTDDSPYGGGQGQVMKCEPIFEAYDDIAGDPCSPDKPYTIFLSPHGSVFSDDKASELAEMSRLLLVCGHYEGMDERVYTLADEVISIGDYILTSGELCALVVIDSVVRKIPGVLGGARSALDESFCEGLLEYPHYTRPASFRSMDVPEVLLSGDHGKITTWRRQQSLLRTLSARPDLLEKAVLPDADREFLDSLENER
jgi:tRNA (guanine37-N1)-methyltransferase